MDAEVPVAEVTASALENKHSAIKNFYQIALSDLEFHERLGIGSYGCVYRADWKSRNIEVAVKKVLQVDNEANVLNDLSHRNIIKLYGVVNMTPSFSLVTEYASNGSLQSYIHKYEYDFELMLRWAQDIASGMHYLHDEAPVQIIHRDLKSTNVVITHDLTCKICDFGTSVYKSNTIKMTLIGTFPWMAPEIISNKNVNEKCDVWSYGVVLWELFTGNFPFKGLQSYQIAYLVVEKEQRLPIPSGCPENLANLMKYCWMTDPRKRPSFKSIKDTLKQIDQNENDKTVMDTQIKTLKTSWNNEIANVFERLKKMENELLEKEKIINERERKLHEDHIQLINKYKRIVIIDYDVGSWNEENVSQWIRSLDDLAVYADLFQEHNINGKRLLMLNKSDLSQLGIMSVGHLVELTNEIEELRKENNRLLHFPPLKPSSSIAAQLSTQVSTKKLSFLVSIAQSIIVGEKLDDYKWKLFLDVCEEDSKEQSALLCIKEVKFAIKAPPFKEYSVNRPPFIMPKWNIGIIEDTRVECTIVYEDKVVRPRSTKFEYILNTQKNVNEKVVIETRESSIESLSSSVSSAISFVSANNSYRGYNNGFSGNNLPDAWKNRRLENAVNPPDNGHLKNNPDAPLWSGILTGKYKRNNSSPCPIKKNPSENFPVQNSTPTNDPVAANVMKQRSWNNSSARNDNQKFGVVPRGPSPLIRSNNQSYSSNKKNPPNVFFSLNEDELNSSISSRSSINTAKNSVENSSTRPAYKSQRSTDRTLKNPQRNSANSFRKPKPK